jgi:hypothetical protein
VQVREVQPALICTSSSVRVLVVVFSAGVCMPLYVRFEVQRVVLVYLFWLWTASALWLPAVVLWSF